MGRTRQFVLLTFACAFFFRFVEVALGFELSAETTSFHRTATSVQPLYPSSAHQGTTVHFNRTGSVKTTPISHRTTAQTTDQHQVTTAPNQNTTAQTGATTTQVTGQTSSMVVSTTAADNTTAVGQTTTHAMETVTSAVKNTSLYSMSSIKQATTNLSTEMTAAATNTTIKYTIPNTQMTAAAVSTTATTKLTVKPMTASGNQTTAPKIPTATAMANTTTIHPSTPATIHPGTQTTIKTTAMTVRPTPAPQPSHIPTGTYTVSLGNWTCIKAVMGLQLMAGNKKQNGKISIDFCEQLGSVNCNESKKLSIHKLGFREVDGVRGGQPQCDTDIWKLWDGAVRAEHNFQWRFFKLYLCKGKKSSGREDQTGPLLALEQDRGNGPGTGVPVREQGVCAENSDSQYQAALTKWSLKDHRNAGMLYYAAIHEKLFTTKLGNSFKCASKQTFSLERNLQLVFVNMQLQAFDIVGNQFGEEEECFPDKNSRAAPIAVGLSILGLFVIAFATFLISRRKPLRGYERI